MKIETTTVDSSYRRRIESTALLSQKGAGKGHRRAVENEGGDKIDLSHGVSLEKIQSFLQTEIGKKVDQMMADAGVDFTAAAGLDWSPEATSARLFDMTTGLFGIWRDQHPKMSETELIDSFETVLRESVDKGADEAVAFIGAAGFGDETREVTDKTMSLLHEKYDTFFSELRHQAGDEREV